MAPRIGRRFDWSSVLDVPSSVATCKSEMYGDWMRDPWSWPELDYLRTSPEPLFDRLGSSQTRFERIAIPKTHFGTRPAVVQSPVDRVVLHALVNSVSARIISDLEPFVMGWRLDRDLPRAGRPVRQRQEWLRFVSTRRELTTEHDAVFKSDITNCFGSIDHIRMEQILRDSGNNRVVDALVGVLGTFNELADRNGLPQRSTASSMLANGFLKPIDAVMARHAIRFDQVPLRWMDDLWVFGNEGDLLRCLLLDIQDELRDLGLDMNLAKTRIREGSEVGELVGEEDLDEQAPERDLAISGSPFVTHSSEPDLDRQFERFIDRPEECERTVLRYICSKIRAFERDDLIDPLIEAIPHAPQGADHFSRLLGSTGKWRELDEWYLEQVNSPVGLERLPWPCSQLGTMFPSTAHVPRVAEVFADRLEKGLPESPEFVALAAHRISKWKPDDARILLRGLGNRTHSPLCRRVAAITLHNLGEEPRRVASILSEFPETAVTRSMLIERGKRRVPENADFDPSFAG